MFNSGDPMPENLQAVRDSSGNTWTRNGKDWSRASWGAAVNWNLMLSMAGPVEPLESESPKKP